MKKIIIMMIIAINIYAVNDIKDFRDLTDLVSLETNKTIFLNDNIDKFNVLVPAVGSIKPKQLFYYYKKVLGQYNLELKYSKKEDVYYVKKSDFLPKKKKVRFEDRVNFYTYKIKNITNEDLTNVFEIFDIKYKYLKQSDYLAYSCTNEKHLNIVKILKELDKSIKQKRVRITFFSLNDDLLNQFGFDFKKIGVNVNDFISNLFSTLGNNHISFSHSSRAEYDAFFTALEKKDIISIKQKPEFLLSNGNKSVFNSVLNIPYLKQVKDVTSNIATKTESYDYKDIGFKISLTPKIKDDWVYLDLNIVSEDLISNDEFKPISQKILYTNKVKVYDNKPLLLTGFKKVSIKKVHSKVPFLGDIPYLKTLFNNDVQTKKIQNISILIEVIGND